MGVQPISISPSNAMNAGRDARSGSCGTLFSQIRLLLRKNLAVYKHNATSTVVQMFMPIFVLLLMAALRVEDLNYNGFNRYTFERKMVPAEATSPMPTCATFDIDACTTPLAIVHEPDDSNAANAVSGVVQRLLLQNQQILATDVEYFNTSKALNNAMLAAPHSVIAALHFADDFSLDGNPSVTIQYNHTAFCVYGTKHCTVPWRDVLLPVQNAVEKAILSEAAGADFDLSVRSPPALRAVPPGANLPNASRASAMATYPCARRCACVDDAD